MSLGAGFSIRGFFWATKTTNLSLAQALSRPSLTFGLPTVIGTIDEGKTTVSLSGTIGISFFSLGFCCSKNMATYAPRIFHPTTSVLGTPILYQVCLSTILGLFWVSPVPDGTGLAVRIP